MTVSDGGSPARTTSTSFNLVAGKAPLTVSADSRFRRYGDLNPEVTVTYAGFVGGEDFTSSGIAGVPTIATAAVSASPVGVYPIMVGPGTLFASHYSFIFENGFLTVGKAPLTIVAEDKSRPYQSQNPMLTYRFVGFVNRDAIDVVSG
ncbi:MAG: MBG domain-containing protein, partial [bacterium]